MDYDFITTCNWASTGTFTLRAYRGSSSDIVTSVSLFYRKKGDASWIETTDGTVVIASTGEWEVANDFNKSGDNCLFHSYSGTTAINSCTVFYLNEVALGTAAGSAFLYKLFENCTNLASMPSGFNIPTGITSVANYFLYSTWENCSSLTEMPAGFNLPTGIVGGVGALFLSLTWYNCRMTEMPSGFNIPTGITSSGSDFLDSAWRSCASLEAMPVGFNLPTGLIGYSGSDFCKYTWMDCNSLASMPAGFDIPGGIISVDADFMEKTWYNCVNLKNDGTYTEPITFEFTTGTDPFGGTCPIDGPSGGTKEDPVEIEVNRPEPPAPSASTITGVLTATGINTITF